MKKIWISMCLAAIIAVGGIVFVNGNQEGEEPSFSVAEKIRSLMLVNNPEALEGVKAANEEYLQWALDLYEADFRGTGRPNRVEELAKVERKLRETYTVIPENSFEFYKLITERYAIQYANNFCMNNLINNEKIWFAACKSESENQYYYDKGYGKVADRTQAFDFEAIEFLKQPEQIEEMVESEIDEEIVDCKIINFQLTTILYMKGVSTDYGIKIFSHKVNVDDLQYLENFKIYTMSELLQSCGNYKILPVPGVFDIKPTYEAEMTSLMEAGLLQGTDKGADPLKPLSRMEATTILVRALGLENEPVSAESQFADVEQGSWGVKYANIALAQGITNGGRDAGR